MAKNKVTPPRMTPQEVERFNAKINRAPGQGPNGDCHEWMAHRTVSNYGDFRTDTLNRAHRLVYYLATGDWPGELNILHHCDNPPCCNPDHLWKGTQKQNIEDCKTKGRIAIGERCGSRKHPETRPRGDQHHMRVKPECVCRGEDHPNSKLTANDVLIIRQKYATGHYSYAALAAEFGVRSQMTIHNVIHRKRWRHL